MKKIQKISIFSSFIGLWSVSYLQQDFQTYLGFFLIFTFGILHGTNDLMLFAKTSAKSKINFKKFLLNYVIIVLLGLMLFWITPIFGLTAFVLVSAYHFGQQHFEYLVNENINYFYNIFYLIYGLFILMLLFVFNIYEVLSIVQEISSVRLPTNFINTTFAIVCFLLLLTGFYIGVKNENFKDNLVLEIFLLMIFSVLFFSTTLIWGFALYFIFWHSIPSIDSQIRFVFGKTNQKSIWQYTKAGLIYWVISIFGVFVLYYFFVNEKLFDSIFFSFLAAITFPHVFVIEKMFITKAAQ